MAKYFGTDGIRGKAYEQLTYELAFSLGKSLAVLKNDRLVIARDTRESGEMLVEAIKQGAKISGIDVLDIGVQPTPKLSYISQLTKSLGVMVTASHNPYQDNGIKVFDSGEKLFLEKEELIEQAMDGVVSLDKPLKVGSDLPTIDHCRMYLKLFQPLLVKTAYRIGLDLANGATYETAKDIFSRVSDELVVLSDKPDGKNINVACGSTHPEELVWTVKNKGLDFGFSFDGDGDRVLMVGRQGEIYDGDLMIYALATYYKQRNELTYNTVILTQMSNLGIIKALKKHGIDVIQTQVGDKYVLEELKNEHGIIGGENSGHIINMKLLNTGDGVLNAISIVKMLFDTGKTMDQICKDVKLFPSKLHNLRNIEKTLVKHPKVIEKVEQVSKELGEDGFCLIRASGTEPLVRITISAETEEIVDTYVETFVKLFTELNEQFERGELS
ncbi:MAG: phosphoglucosamine mutase [Candidatus Izemoplasmatales bacterium]